MYSTKSEGPRRGRSFDSMNLGLTLEEKQLNNEVSAFLPSYLKFDIFICLFGQFAYIL